jgi:UDP-glucuronate 4-epimerase
MKIFITGTAGFIGFHLANLLLKEGFQVFGYDGLTSYYDVNLKKKRNEILLKNSKYFFTCGMLEDEKKIEKIFFEFEPDVVIHLAAQAGVRYSLENPRSYLDSNIIGTFNIMEMSKKYGVRHLLMASTSSVYGANTDMPFKENSKSDTQLTIYAATKKATESMAHSYAHLWKLPITMFRFFTVYGPWGRPDMALFKFVSAILEERPIDIYNQGEMYRDFTYVEDLVLAIRKLINVTPDQSKEKLIQTNDSISSVAPYRIVNIGNSKKIKLLDFIEAIEKNLKKKAIRNYLPIQKGDVPETLADTNLLRSLIDYQPNTNFHEGIKSFIEWYREYYNV